MPHPFFEVTVYPLHRPEASALLDELANAIANGNAIDLIYQQCGDNLPALFLGQSPPLIWKEALQNLTSRGFLRKLLDLVQPQFGSVQMQKVIRDVINAESAEEVTFISQEMPQEIVGKPPMKKNEGIRISKILEGASKQNLIVP